ncbi:MAG: quinol:cytochrome C oxidoreductase [Ignavibacteriae bacterium]|nr:MAG: quinol:cytochrome C oxidoreductase [Ignavibacteriota bacterium]
MAAFHNIVGFLFLTSIGLGALFLIALDYVAGSVWSVPMRRVNEFLAALVPFTALLALPVLFFLPEVFSWAKAESAVLDPVVESKRLYLNVNFFIIRFVVLFIIWTVFYYVMTGNSVKQDLTKDQKHTRWNIRLGAAFMPVFAFGITAIAIDWSMSLEPHWYSTIYGVYYFSGTVIAALAAATYIIIQLHEHGYLQNLRSDHFYSLGTLLFVFVNFWAYIAFSQFLLIWYANIPEETVWFIMRWKNGWQAVSILLLLVQFWVPYFMLLSQESKMNLKRLKFMSIWLLLAHLLDLYWLVMPTYNSGVPLSWTMIGVPSLSVGLTILVLAWNMKRKNIMPIGDPRLKRGLEFHL